MITRLYLDNCFTHKNRTFHFKKGLTGVIGPNESGKSLIVEMIRYALFGSKALRGAAADYKNLHVELDFQIGDRTFSVIRKGTRAKLTEFGDEEDAPQQVTGTTTVNKTITTLLGYDLVVFDVANACNQGDVERLTRMSPGQRKSMVDQTVGLNVLDDVIKFCGDEGNALKREAQAFESALVEPEEPTEPCDITEDIHDLVVEAKEKARELQDLRAQVRSAPAKPEDPNVPVMTDEAIEELEQSEARRQDTMNEIRSLEKGLKLTPEKYTKEELDEAEDLLDQAQAWKTKQRLLAQGEHECPECGHTWPVADLGDVADAQEVEAPLSSQDINRHRALLGNRDTVAGLRQSIDELENTLPLDKSEQLKRARKDRRDRQAYEEAYASWAEFNKGLPEKEARIKELEGWDEEYETRRELQAELNAYHREQARYEKAKEKYDEALTQHQELVDRSEAFLSSRKAVQDLKVRIKTHLLPSLNKVSSVLLSRMTGGERSKIEIDPDFNILVDGQSVETLSGSASAVANLSIRIALGQILTNQVFSVFLGDEVDAAMDEERAEYTAKALRRLTETVSQVIQVTHQRPETDHTIELRKA